jgi:2'-5' RNA ligase
MVAQLIPARLIRALGACLYCMRFEHDTYVVLDMPPPIWKHVKSIRERYASPLAILPVEITVIGSSGIGTLHEEQEIDAAFEHVDSVAANFAPFITAFSRVTTFPNTGVFYYEPKDPHPFIKLQSEIVSTGLKFKESPFPFTPHCTIVKLDNPSQELVNEIMSLPVPRETFALDALSVYSLEGYDCRLLHKVELSGSR